MIVRILEAVRKGYYKANDRVLEYLLREYTETMLKVGLACCEHTCNNFLLRDFVEHLLTKFSGLSHLKKSFNEVYSRLNLVPGGTKTKSASVYFTKRNNSQGKTLIKGFLIEESTMNSFKSITVTGLPFLWIYFIFYQLIAITLILGYLKKN